jgi:hypothetical protein
VSEPYTPELRRFINFPVPEERWEEAVIAFARMVAPRQELASDSAAQGAATWSREEISRLARDQDLRPAARSMLELTASRPGEPVTIEEVLDKSGRSHGGVRADLAVFTRLLKRDYQGKEWPVKVDSSGTALYTMSHERAEWWNAASSG